MRENRFKSLSYKDFIGFYNRATSFASLTDCRRWKWDIPIRIRAWNMDPHSRPAKGCSMLIWKAYVSRLFSITSKNSSQGTVLLVKQDHLTTVHLLSYTVCTIWRLRKHKQMSKSLSKSIRKSVLQNVEKIPVFPIFFLKCFQRYGLFAKKHSFRQVQLHSGGL